MTHHGVVDIGGPGVAKDQGIPGNLLLSPLSSTNERLGGRAVANQRLAGGRRLTNQHQGVVQLRAGILKITTTRLRNKPNTSN